MSSKLLPISIPFKVKKQSLLSNRKVIEAKPFNKRWPKILSYMIAHPDKDAKQLWHKFSQQLDDVFSVNEFRKLLAKNGMMPGKVKQATGVKQQVAVAIQSFAEVKKERANLFMNRISKKLDEIHDVVDAEKANPKNVGYVLELVSKLHKEGRIAYSIDDEHTVDKRATNIAVLIGYEPTPKTIGAKVIDA